MKRVYIPTESELKIIKAANTVFLKTYLSFILVGIGTSVAILKKSQLKMRSKYGFLTVFGVSMTSEIIGRNVGKSLAKREFEKLDQEGELIKLIKSSGEFGGKALAFPNPVSKGDDDYYVGLDGNTYSKNAQNEKLGNLDNLYTVNESAVKPDITLHSYQNVFEIKEENTGKKTTNQYGDIIE